MAPARADQQGGSLPRYWPFARWLGEGSLSIGVDMKGLTKEVYSDLERSGWIFFNKDFSLNLRLGVAELWQFHPVEGVREMVQDRLFNG